MPNECCGLVGGNDGVAKTVYRARNSEASPLRYNLDPKDQFRIMSEMDERGEELAAIYHSHTRSEAYPSQTDINLALMDRREGGELVGKTPLFPGDDYRSPRWPARSRCAGSRSMRPASPRSTSTG